MKYCFGGVLICKTKEQAKRVAFDKSVKKKVITLEGDVYDPAGMIYPWALATALWFTSLHSALIC